MQIKVSGETPFKSNQNSFTIGATDNGFTLCYSATKDGVYTEYDEATPAGEVCIVNGITPYTWFKLKNNSGEVVVVI